ncbi:MAG: aminotransferase class V-fold PLP-dependent enzyme, partial [Microbacterium gubbeenense]
MIYLDHAATTPLRDEARDAWLEAQRVTGNASSVHGAGQNARRVLEEARERVAATLGAEPIEVVFTSGGTESVGSALQG